MAQLRPEVVKIDSSKRATVLLPRVPATAITGRVRRWSTAERHDANDSEPTWIGTSARLSPAVACRSSTRRVMGDLRSIELGGWSGRRDGAAPGAALILTRRAWVSTSQSRAP